MVNRQIAAMTFYLLAFALALLTLSVPVVGFVTICSVAAVLTPDILNWVDKAA